MILSVPIISNLISLHKGSLEFNYSFSLLKNENQLISTLRFYSPSSVSIMRHLLLISSSRVHGYEYLEVAKEEIKKLLNSSNASKVLFVPYASNDHDAYLKSVTPVFKEMGFEIESIHNKPNPIEAVESAEAIFIGGGNTFNLLKKLYDYKVIETIKTCVLNKGTPYIGSSAGTNVATVNIHTTNDMPIIYPQSFDALNLVPFNINPHYIETEAGSEHKGETRDQRINEYLEMPHSKPVLGLREGSMLRVNNERVTLKGIMGAKLFAQKVDPKEYEPNADLSFLMNV